MATGKPGKPAKKAAAKPAKPAKSARPAKSAKPSKPAKPARPAKATKAAKPPARTPAAEEPEAPATGWAAAPAAAAPSDQWVPMATVPQPAPRPRPQPPPFDPATGAWLPPPPMPAAGPVPPLMRAAAGGADAPDAPKTGTTSYVLWSVLLWLDLGLLALQVLAVIFAGIVLIAAPDSEMAESFREGLEFSSPMQLLIGTLVSLLAFGVIPLVWVIGTRRDPVEGTKRFLHLHDPARSILKGILLAIPLLLAVVVLSTVYVLLTQGPEGLTNPEEETNPAVEAILDNLTWPLAILVALGAGIGEEIFFRGFLQRYIGVWGQSVLFGLAHAAGGYVPQIVFALGLGIFFGFLVKRGWSLYTLITAHAVYDLVLLSLGMLAR